ncbi:DUF2169 domain-containing protein [Archangium sp.]|uniref:DUF2169 family type VI secretion system accessory protein n=1 Tax=Archangium sp. TaxID=1872627 RepID=UPI002D6D8BED|nr:DUF2169 domain-containing protein [Archangium sp.]HYO55769.1 DUF2169 domain-containing protein [Archangium sp.]
MLEVANRTPFRVALTPWVNGEGLEFASILVKGTFDIRGASEPLLISDAQVPVVSGDQYRGNPATASIQYASDTCPIKHGTDIALVGHAYATKGSTTSVDVGLQVGDTKKVLRVFGERVWYRSLLSWEISAPRRFERMPLLYERAFGGVDTTHPDPAMHAGEMRNPVGTGFAASSRAERLEGLRLPNLEDPLHLIHRWNDRPPPMGFGFIAPSWMARARHAGTYDEKWKQGRSPFLPTNFDEQFFNAASPDLIVRPHLKGSVPVKLVGSCREGILAFTLPDPALELTVTLKGKKTEYVPVLDTVILEPDERRVVLCWRVRVPCFRQLLYLERVVVAMRGTGR